MQIYILAGLIVAIVAVVFALQNPGSIQIKFLSWQFQGSLPLVLLLVFSVGFICSLLFSIEAVIKRKIQMKMLKKKIAELENPSKEEASGKA